MKLLLLDTKFELCEAWRTSFEGVSDVQIHQGKFEPLIGTYDCFVSPANSFGLMDGGIDANITDFFGYALQQRVQDEIWRVNRGEQPVGTCLLVPTEDPRCPWLAHCPTMRVPMEVAWTNHAYAAFLAALTTAGNAGIKTLACPGLGTHTGRIPPEVAARQMRFAYDLWSGPRIQPEWGKLSEREWRSSGRPREEFLRHRFKLEQEWTESHNSAGAGRQRL